MILQVSVGTLLAFTVVAISILILRYVPPDEVPPPSSLRESSDSVYLQFSCNAEEICSGNPNGRSGVGIAQHLPANERTLLGYPLIHKEADQGITYIVHWYLLLNTYMLGK